jgi:hypothetical protein
MASKTTLGVTGEIPLQTSSSPSFNSVPCSAQTQSRQSVKGIADRSAVLAAFPKIDHLHYSTITSNLYPGR